MSKDNLPINANILEVNDGRMYQVKLDWIPRSGELIDLTSFADQAGGYAYNHHYEVMQVVHELCDVAESGPQSHKGGHHIVVHVKPSQSEYLQS